jgi:hypothetical protein
MSKGFRDLKEQVFAGIGVVSWAEVFIMQFCIVFQTNLLRFMSAGNSATETDGLCLKRNKKKASSKFGKRC